LKLLLDEIKKQEKEEEMMVDGERENHLPPSYNHNNKDDKFIT